MKGSNISVAKLAADGMRPDLNYYLQTWEADLRIESVSQVGERYFVTVHGQVAARKVNGNANVIAAG